MARDLENVKCLQREWYRKNKELTKQRARDWAAANPDRRQAIVQKARQKRVEQHLEYNRKWFSEHPWVRAAYQNLYRAQKAKAAPPWLTTEDLDRMEAIYKASHDVSQATGVKYHVDHIVPLNHDLVCGLHVPANLQVLTGTANMKKHGKFVVE